MNDMKVAVAQIEIASLSKEENRAAIERAVVDAAAQGCQLVVLPELSNTGFIRSYDASFARVFWEAAEPHDGPLFRSLGALASRHRIAVVVGLAVRHPVITGVLRNMSVLFAADGSRHEHVKVHLPRDEKRYFEEGAAFAVADIASARLGMLVCADIAFPEAARCLALRGAELIAVPMCAPTPANPVLYTGLAAARAYENQAYVLIANRVGSDHGVRFGGGSVIAAPDGTVLATLASEPDMAVAEIAGGLLVDERLRQTRYRDRRPSTYGAITQDEPVQHSERKQK